MSISDLEDSDLEFASADEGTSLSSESDNEVVTDKKPTKDVTKVETKPDNNDSKTANDESQTFEKQEASDKNRQDEKIVEEVCEKQNELQIDNNRQEPEDSRDETHNETTIKHDLEDKNVETKPQNTDLENDELKNTSTPATSGAAVINESPVIHKSSEQDAQKLGEKLSDIKLENENRNENKKKTTTTEPAKTTPPSKTLKKLDDFSDLSESDDENDKNKQKKIQHSDSSDSGSGAEDTSKNSKKVNEQKTLNEPIKPVTIERKMDEEDVKLESKKESKEENEAEKKPSIDAKLEKTEEKVTETNEGIPSKAHDDDTEVNQPLEEKNEEIIKREDVNVEMKVEAKKEENVASGWNDTEFSDIDDNDDDLGDKRDYEKYLAASTIEKHSANTSSYKEKQKQININKGEGDSFWKENLVYENVKNQEPIQQQTKSQPRQDSQQQQQQLLQQESQQKSWSWSKFGTSLFSTATTFTSQLADGLNSVIGAPDPLELALKNKKEKQEIEDPEEKKGNEDANGDENQTKDASEWADNFNDNSDWFSAIPINKITNTLVTGSLDVLETVGKKTIEMINDKDPNLKQTRELIKKAAVPAKPNLSQLLREAQQESEKQLTNTNASSSQSSSPYTYARKIEPNPNKQQTFNSYFEEFKGSSYLEALEMLSRQYNVKFEMLSINERKLNQIIKPLNVVFNLDDLLNEDDDADSEQFDFENFEDLIIDYISEVNVKVQATVDKVIQSFKTASDATKQTQTTNELFNESVRCFALTTSTLIELYHKIAETLLIQQQNDKNSLTMVTDKAEHLCQITKLCTRSTTMIANDFCRKIKSTQDKTTSSSQTIANIYIEASNSNTYIADSFVLLAPIFKCLALDEMEK